MNDSRKVTRRRHSAEVKAQVLRECAQPGASVARVALSHGINANVVHKWRRLAGGRMTASPAPIFVPVALPKEAAPDLPDIHIELRRGATVIALKWPVAAAADCAAWLRELLK